MERRKILVSLIIVLLLAGNVFFAYEFLDTKNKLMDAEALSYECEENKPVLDFTDMFVEKVLKSESEVDFETRLELENAVRDLEDAEILDQWNRFVNANTEVEAQTEVKELLSLLLSKSR